MVVLGGGAFSYRRHTPVSQVGFSRGGGVSFGLVQDGTLSKMEAVMCIKAEDA